jgi:hypothetical protein
MGEKAAGIEQDALDMDGKGLQVVVGVGARIA